MGKNKNKNKKHKSHNKHSRNNKKKSQKIQKAKKTAKKDAFMFTKLFIQKWPYINGLFAILLLFRLGTAIRRSKINYISFILFFALQFYGYALLFMLTIASLEIIKVVFFEYVRNAVKKLFTDKPKKHLFLKNYPWFDYITTFLGPHLFMIALYLFVVLLVASLLFMFIIPFAILLLGYTK
jgi:hypothetical protein